MEQEAYRRMASDEGVHWWFVARRLILRSLIQSIQPGPKTILEIGCGSGGNLSMLAGLGKVCGVECNPDAYRIAKTRFPDAEILFGKLPEQLSLGERKFDLICALDVLEHIDDDRGALRALRNNLAPEGKVLLTVPAYQWMYGKHDSVHHHVRRYNATSVAQMASAGGFRVRYLGYFNTLLFPIAAIMRLAERFLPFVGRSDRPLSPTINEVMKRIFALERHFMPRFVLPYGLSIVAILSIR